MGNDLGLSGPPQPVPSQEGKDQRETPDRHPPGRAPLPTPPGHQVPRGDPSPGCQPSGRPAQRRGQTSEGRFGVAPRRRYPTQQPRYAPVGCLPTVCWTGSPKKPVLSVGKAQTVCRSGTVRVPPLDRRLTRRPGPGLILSCTQPSQSAKARDPSAPQRGAAALPERKRRRSPAGEDPILLAGPETQGGCPAGPGQGQSAVWAPLGSQDSDAHLSKRPRRSSERSSGSSTAAGIPVPVRNAISSSYSSTGGLLRLRKRGRPSSSASCGPAASCSKTPERPAKVTGEEALGPRSSTSPPSVTDRESQRGRAVGAAAETPGLGNSPPTPGSSWPQKRKFAPSSAAFWGPIKRQAAPRFPAFPEYAGVAATVAPSPAKIARLMGPVDASRPQRLPANSLGLKPAAPCVGLIAAPAMILASDTKPPPALQAETSAKVATPQGLDKPRTPPPDAVLPGAAPENVTAPMFKTTCMTSSGSERAGPLPSGPILTTPTSSSSNTVMMTSLKLALGRLAKHVK